MSFFVSVGEMDGYLSGEKTHTLEMTTVREKKKKQSRQPGDGDVTARKGRKGKEEKAAQPANPCNPHTLLF